MVVMMLHPVMALLAALQAPTGPACNPEGSQMEMNACAGDAFERADAEFNTLWRRTITGARANDRSPDNGRMAGDDRTEEATLREAQRAWVNFRDAHCTWEGFAERGGSLEPMVYEECRARLTRERTAQLSPQPAPNE